MTHYEIDIAINDKIWTNEIPDIKTIVQKTLQLTVNEIITNAETIEISIMLADNIFVQKLNLKYRGKDKPTNVLSFPITEQSELTPPTPFISLGDIIIAYESIVSESIEQNKSFQDHFTHILVHGCLHLMHFDHIDDKDAKEMEELEINILKSMDIKNPYEIL